MDPKRILGVLSCALIEDAKEPGRGWLVMMNRNLLIQTGNLSPTMTAKAIQVRDTPGRLLKAGANGDL